MTAASGASCRARTSSASRSSSISASRPTRCASAGTGSCDRRSSPPLTGLAGAVKTHPLLRMRAVMQLVTLRCAAAVAVWCSVLARPSSAQQRDTTTPPRDSLKVYTLPPAVVSVTRANPPISKIPLAVHLVDKTEISRARPTWGLDEALVTVPGVYAANRYNFSLDQRISIRGFGARSQFAVRGIKVLVDGIPQTLPDGQGQLTNLELGAADRIEVLRGSSSALFGNASGGVISIWTDPVAPEGVAEDVRVLAGTFDRHLDRNWTKWQSSTSFRVGRGGGSGLVTVSQLDYTGQRQHSDADLRNLNSRWHFPLASGWSLTATADLGWDPRADNPGALTAGEMARNPDSAAAINITRVAGKNVTQGQGGVTVRRDFAGGGEAALTVFGFTRSLKNPTTFAYIDLDRVDYGTRLTVSRPVPLGALQHRLTAGVDGAHQPPERRRRVQPRARSPEGDDVRGRRTRRRRGTAELLCGAVHGGGARRAHLVSGPRRHDGAGLLPERRPIPPSGRRAGRRARERRGPHADDDLDLFGLPLLELHRGRHGARRPGAPRDPPALAALPSAGAAWVRAPRLGGDRGDPFLGLPGERCAQHEHASVVDHERAPGVERDARQPAVRPLRGLRQCFQPVLRRIGGDQRLGRAVLRTRSRPQRVCRVLVGRGAVTRHNLQRR